MNDTLVISNKDNVGICLKEGSTIPVGHKFALYDIPKNSFVIKYGAVIGRAKHNIKKGEWVHTHNLRSHLDEKAKYYYDFSAVEFKAQKGTFKGFKRAWGRAGIRNEIYIIPTVGCVNNVCLKLQKAAQKYISGSLDGIFALTHQFGCSQLGDDNENIRKLLVSIAKNPNASFVLFVGLGCENNRLCDIESEISEFNSDGHITFFNAQDVEDEIEFGLNILEDFAQKAAVLKREDVDFSELSIGLKCGGSDAFSGLTANPLVGTALIRG